MGDLSELLQESAKQTPQATGGAPRNTSNPPAQLDELLADTPQVAMQEPVAPPTPLPEIAPPADLPAGPNETVIPKTGDLSELLTDQPPTSGDLRELLVDDRSTGDLFSDAFKRGSLQVASAPLGLAGIAAEATGYDQQAQTLFDDYQAINKMAPPARIGNFSDINNLEDFTDYVVEAFGENSPTLLALVSGAGVGAGTAQLVGKGFIKSAVNRKLLTKAAATAGAGGVGFTLESADSGAELKEATGSWQPSSSLSVGAINSALEFYAPFKVFKGLGDPAASLIGTGLKGAGLEGLTELAQETVTAGARAIEDQNYDFWSKANALRIVDAGLKGAIVGGPISTLAHGGAEITDSQPGKDAGFTKADFADLPSWDNPLRFLRQRTKPAYNPADTELFQVNPLGAVEDYSELSKLTPGLRATWDHAKLEFEQREKVKDFEDAQMPRYVMQMPDGKWSNPLTSYDLQLEMTQFPQQVKPKVYQVDLQSMAAGKITAEAADLPISNLDNRVFTMPWVDPQEKANLLREFSKLTDKVKEYQKTLLRSRDPEEKAAAKAAINAIYQPLVSRGLRVVPSRGSSFIYSGEVAGKEVDVASINPIWPTQSNVNYLPQMMTGLEVRPPKTEYDPVGNSGQVDPDNSKTAKAVTFNPAKISYEDGFFYGPISVAKERTIEAYLRAGKPDMVMAFKPGLTQEEKMALLEEGYQLVLADNRNEADYRSLHARGATFKNFGGFDRFYVLRPIPLSKMMPGLYAPALGKRDFYPGDLGVVWAKEDHVQIERESSISNPEFEAFANHLRKLRETYSAIAAKHGLPDNFRVLAKESQSGIFAGSPYYMPSNNTVGFSFGSLQDWKKYGGPFDSALKKDFLQMTTEIFFHEVGHYVSYAIWDQLPFEVQETFMTGYQRALLNQRVNGDSSRLDNMPPQTQLEYTMGLSEYLAEQFRRWAGTNQRAQTEVEKFLKKGANALEVFGKEFFDKLPIKEAYNLFHPSWEYSALIEYMRQTYNEDTTLNDMRSQRKALPTGYEVPASLKGLWTQAQEAVDNFRTLMPKDTNATLSAAVETADDSSIVFGQYLPVDKMITLFIGSFAALPNVKTPAQVLVHEIAHSVEDKFTEAEYKMLTDAGIAAKVIPEKALASYRLQFYREAKALGLTEDREVMDYVDRELQREYLAHMLEARVNGSSYTVEINGWLDYIWQLAEKIANLLAGNGFTSVEGLVQKFFRGEIAKREDSTLKSYSQGRAQQARLNADRQYFDEDSQMEGFEPTMFEKVNDRMWVVGEFVGTDKTNPDVVNLKFFAPPPAGKAVQGKDPMSAVRQLGEMIGLLELSNKTKTPVGGYEVSMVEVAGAFQGEGYNKEMYEWAEKKLKFKAAPSGMLIEPGYRMWKKWAPEKVKYHVFDPVRKDWYSPNYIRHMLQLEKSNLAVVQAAETRKPGQLDYRVAQVRKWENLYAKVDPKAWSDPLLRTIYSRGEKSIYDVVKVEQELGIRRVSLDAKENSLTQAITGEEVGETRASYEQSYQRAQQRSKMENARKLRIPVENAAPRQAETAGLHAIWGGRGHNNKRLAPHLRNSSNIPYEADRISWFSKMFLGIQQIAWRNEHIPQLRKYVNAIQTMNAYRMRQVARADETARTWNNLPEEQRNNLGEFLFWLTEMRYRTRSEVASGVVRQPTPQEIAQQVQRLRLQPETQALYTEIAAQFDAFLVEVETISTEQLNRTFANNPVGLQAALKKLAADMQQMRAKPYFPFMRFGRWSLTFRDGSGNIEWFSTYATENERDAVARNLATSNRFIGSVMQVGKVPEEAMEFQGLPGPLIERILDPASGLPGLTAVQQKWLQEFKVQNSPENSFRKRWLERKGTPGYSLDAFRVFSHYFSTGSNYLAKLKYKDQIKENITSLRSELPSLPNSKSRVTLIETLQSHFNYIMEGGREFGKLKAFISLWQLGYSPAAAAMNLTQTPSVTVPYFMGIYGPKAVPAVMKALGAIKRAAFPKPQNYNLQFEAARLEMQNQGKLDVGQAPELGAYAEGSNLSHFMAGDAVQRGWRNVSYYGMWMFGKMEQMNREIAFSAAWDLAMSDPNNRHLQEIERRNLGEVNRLLSQSYNINGQQVSLTYDQAVATIAAREAIDRTQFVFQPWARPKFLQNRYASIFLVFFGYVQAMAYAFGNNPGKVAMWFTAFALYGLMGLPGAEDGDEILKMLSRLSHKWFGKDFSIEENVRDWVVAATEGTVLDKVGPDLLLHGISRFSFGAGLIQEGYGIPQFDASANGSLGKMVPGLADVARGIGNGSSWQDITAVMARDAAGAGFGQMFALLQFLQSDPFTADAKKWEKVLPRAVKAGVKSYRMMTTGQEVDSRGNPIAKFDIRDPDDLATIVAQAAGFTPTKVNQVWEAKSAFQDTEKWLESRKKSIGVQYFEALQSKNMEALKDVRAAVLRFNREAKESGYGAMSFTADSLRQSLQAKANIKARAQVGLPPENSRIQLQNSILKTHPGAATVVEEMKVK